MKSQTLFIYSCLSLSALVSAPLWAQDAPPRSAIKASEEVQLQKLTPTVKRFTIKLEGSVREQTALTDIEKIIRDIFSHSRIGTVAVSVHGEPMPNQMQVYENLQIVVNAKKLDEVEQEQYRVNLHLQEHGDEPKKSTQFTYDPMASADFKQALQAYLSTELNLQPKTTTPSATTVAPDDMSDKAATKAMPDDQAITPPMMTETPVAVTPPSPPSPETIEAGVPNNVNPNEEIQLQNVTPTVKRFAIQLEGSEREANALNDIERMIREIFNESRIGTTVVQVSGEPVAQSMVKAYENLEIVVNAQTGEEVGQPYRVNITLREAGMSAGEPEMFSYVPAYPDVFYSALKEYLSNQLNLRPKAR